MYIQRCVCIKLSPPLLGIKLQPPLMIWSLPIPHNSEKIYNFNFTHAYVSVVEIWGT